jgi:hypothetical protein
VTSSPWRLGDLVSLVAALAAGLAAIVAGWIGVSGEPTTSQQTAWLNVGIGGLVVAGIGVAVWLMTGRRAVGERRRHLLPDVAATLAASAPATVDDDAAEALVVLPGMTRYHRPTCELMAGKKAMPLGRRRSRRALAPCGVCEPDPIEVGA